VRFFPKLDQDVEEKNNGHTIQCREENHRHGSYLRNRRGSEPAQAHRIGSQLNDAILQVKKSCARCKDFVSR